MASEREPRLASARRRSVIQIGAAASCVALALALAACGSSASAGSASASSKKSYVVGVSEDASGATAAFFVGVAGIQAYFKHLDEHGGAGGHQVTVKVLNDQGDPATAATNFTELNGQGALAIVWSTLSNAYIPLQPKAAALKIPMFIISLLSKTPLPYVYGLENESSHSENYEVSFIKNLLSSNAHIRIAVVAGDTTGGHTEVTNASAYARSLGMTVSTQQFTPVDDVGLQANASAILASHPDAVITAVDPVGTPSLDQILRQDGFKGPVVGFWAAAGDSVFAKNKDPNYYAYRNYASPSDATIPAAKTMSAIGKATGYPPTTDDPAYTGYYLIGQALAQAIEKCNNSCTPDIINTDLEHMGTMNTNGLSLNVGLTPSNHDFVHEFQFYHWDTATNSAVKIGSPIMSQ
jgi:branched-chain amino acid transport system substrate-binding protein